MFIVFFFLLVQESTGEPGGTYVEDNRHVLRSLEEREDDLWFIYTPIFTVS